MHILLIDNYSRDLEGITAWIRQGDAQPQLSIADSAGALQTMVDQRDLQGAVIAQGAEGRPWPALLELLRRRRPTLPVILVGDLDPADGLAALNSGASDVVLTQQLYRIPAALRAIAGAPSLHAAADVLSPALSLQEALEHDAHFRTLFEGAPIGIAVARAGVTVAVNPAYLRMFGYAAADALIGQPLLRNIAPQEQPRIAERARQREQGVAVPNAYETIGQRADGSQFPFLVEVARVSFDGDPVSLAFFTDITARKQAERLVEEQRERLSVTLASIGDGVIATDTAGRVTLINPVAEALTGWAMEEVLGRPLDEVFAIIDEQTRARVENPVARAMREGLVVGLANHTVLLARDGQETPIDDRSAPIRDAEGRLLGAVLSFRDVTERRRAEAALREQEALFRTMADSAPVLLWVADASKAYTFFNQPWLTFTGRTLAQEAGYGWAEGVHPDDYARYFQTYTGAFDARQPFSMDYRLRRADGVFRWVLDNAVPRWTSEGDFLGYIGSCIDITERKEAETRDRFLYELLDATRSLSDSAAITATAARLLGAHLGVDRCAYAPVDADEDHFTITGDYTTPGTVSIVGHFAMSDFGPEVLRLMRADEPYVVVDSGSDPRTTESQAAYLRTQIVAVICVPLKKDGRFVAAMAVHQRVSRVWTAGEVELVRLVANLCWESIERGRVVRALRASEEHLQMLVAQEQVARTEAEVAVRLRDQFFSVAAHELKTPLTSLLGNAQLLLRRAEREGLLGERERRNVQVIVTQVQRLNRMVLALLDVSRLQTGQLAIERAPLDLSALVTRLVDEARPALEGREIELVCSHTPPVVEGDALRLEQVVQNLLQNALKYSAPPAPVQIVVSQHNGFARVSVRDEGIGIPQTSLARLFQRFFRAENVNPRQVTGLGIGLYVVKEIVTLHDGTVEVASEEGVGSTFTISLPLASGAVREPGAA